MLYPIKFNNNIIKHGAVMALCFMTIMSCNRKHEDEKALPLITDYIVDSLYLPISEADNQVRWIKETGRGKYAPEELIAFVRDRNYKLYTYDMKNGCYIDSLPLAKFRNEYIDFYQESKDSIYVGQRDNTLVGLFNRKEIRWHLKPITEMIGKHVHIGYLSAYPLQVFNDTVICTTTTSEPKKKEGPNIPFIDANYNIMFLLKGDTIEYLAKYNPNPQYFKRQGYYSDIERAYINNNEIVYSFSHSDTLSLYNFITGKERRVKLKTKNFFPNSPFDYSKIMDYKYITEYEMENSRLGLGLLFYNNAQHKVYQILQHKGKYIEADGKKNDFEDLTQSLFVLDDKLNQIKEILIPPRTFSSSSFAFTTYKGLYFAAHNSKQKYNDKMLFYRIVVR